MKTIEDLGYEDYAAKIIEKNLKRTYGMVLMTGPTGSGKSTTLFAMLSSYDPFKYNISTLEDPIEYFIPGVNQSQVNPEIGYDFPDGLRSLVRQDPDIIMVGEIRDKVTASLAVNAAITGHLVFSTLHANSAAGTVQRLMNMGVDPFLVVSALNLIVSQRLVRKICPQCRQEFSPDAQTLGRVRREMSSIPGMDQNPFIFYKGAGCDLCRGEGYIGRISIYELLELSEDISHAIIENRGVAEEVEKIAIEKQGMVTMKQNGVLSALRGETTLEEVFIAADVRG
ncbi:type II/IV secretion system protein [Candidatus Peregrinibacteria bacterium]|nr:type II/IV secretion system protein [Candidatus Peregrinibacteria bacterium]